MEFATGAMGALLPKLGELLRDEYNLQKSVKQGIMELTSELEHMQAALVKVSDVPLEKPNLQVQIWASEVREMSYAIEDSLDSCLVRNNGFEPSKHQALMGFIDKTKNEIIMLKARHEMADDIKHINSQVIKVKERYDRYRIDDDVANLATTIDPRLSALYNKVSDLVGIDEAMGELMKMLSNPPRPLTCPKNTLKAISVVGFGGLGKTTLAKALYDDLKNRFDCCSFVPVGQKPDIKKVLRDILHELDKQNYRNITSSQMDARQLIDELKGFLVDKRYLIVIDDVWDTSTWEMLKYALEGSKPQSRIIVTTRIFKVAEIVGAVYNMKPLSDDKSKQLFCRRLWSGKGTSPDDLSAEVSTKILRKCGGVPLAIITIASLLVCKRREDWPKVYDSIGFGNDENEAAKNTTKILSFSYYDLPPWLKNCLLHLSIFPEDHLIMKRELIWIWVAEGFIPVEQGSRSFDLGESYFNQLVNRSMIRLIKHCGTTQGTTQLDGCRVHDMVLDLIRKLSSELNFVTVYDTDQGPHTCSSPSKNRTTRRLALHRRTAEHNPISMEMGRVKSLNATLCTDNRLLQLLSFKVLRVLVLDNCNFPGGACHLEHIGKLVHLRYLGLVNNTPVVELPVDIGHDLKFLQTLDISGSDVVELPSSVAEMSKLMCLRANKDTRMIGGIGRLTSLVVLELYSVDKCPNFVTELRKLTRMRVLEIHFDELDKSMNKALLQSLPYLCGIQFLSITSENEYTDDGDWEAWAPPLDLCELSLLGISLLRRPSWMDSTCFPHLSHLKFKEQVVEQDDMRILGKLPALRHLVLMTCYSRPPFTYTFGSDEFQNLRYLLTTARLRFSTGAGALPVVEELIYCMRVGMQDVCGLVPGNMPLLQRVFYGLDCEGCSREEVEVTEAALRHAAEEVHPNCPAIDMLRQYYEFQSDDDNKGDDESEEYVSTADHDDGEGGDSEEEVLPTDQEYMKREYNMTYPVDDIEETMSCKLLVRLQDGDGIEAARGLVYPTEGTFIDGQLIDGENAKVTVQHVEKVFESVRLRFCPNDEITLLGHAQGRDIQWPRRDIVVVEGPLASLVDAAPLKANEALSPSITNAYEVPDMEAPLLLDLVSAMDKSEALVLPSTPGGDEVPEKENQLVELTITIEAPEVAVKTPWIPEAHQPDEMFLVPNAQKKMTGKRNRGTNGKSKDNSRPKAPKVSVDKEYPVAALAEKYLLGEPWLKPPGRILSLGPWSQRLHDYYMLQCRLPLRERTTLISVEFKKEHFHHDYEECNLSVSFQDLWEFYNYREVETSIIRVFALSMLKQCRNMEKKYGFLDPLILCGEQIMVKEMCVVEYLANAMLLLQDMELIVVPYLQGGHYILIVIMPDHPRVFYVNSLLSAKFDLSIPKKVFAEAWRIYRKNGGKNGPELLWHDEGLPCHQQVFGTSMCAYFVWHNMKLILGDLAYCASQDNIRKNLKDVIFAEAQMCAIQEDVAQFLFMEVLDATVKFDETKEQEEGKLAR